MLVVPGHYEQFWMWARRRFRPEIKSASRGAGSFVTDDGTRYQCVSSPDRARGHDRSTPVIRIGDWDRHDWAYRLRERFTDITDEDV